MFFDIENEMRYLFFCCNFFFIHFMCLMLNVYISCKGSCVLYYLHFNKYFFPSYSYKINFSYRGLYFDKHLQFIHLNNKFVPFTQKNLSYLHKVSFIFLGDIYLSIYLCVYLVLPSSLHPIHPTFCLPIYIYLNYYFINYTNLLH